MIAGVSTRAASTARLEAQGPDASPEARRAAVLEQARRIPGRFRDPEALFRWRYEPGPDADRPGQAWVLWEAGLRAWAGQVPASLMVGGRSVEAGILTDLEVDPAASRDPALGPLVSQSVAPGASAFTLESRPWHRDLLTRAGWVDLGPVPAWLRPVHPGQLAALRGRSRTSARLLAGVLRAADGLVGLLGRQVLEAREVEAFDPSLEIACRAAAYRHQVSVRRTPEWLRWRFAEAPEAARYRRFQYRFEGVPAGYAVVSLAPGPGLRRGLVEDFVAEPDLMLPVLHHAVSALAEAGADLVETTFLGPDMHRLRWLGFVQRPSRWHLLVRPPEGAGDQGRLLTGRAGWYLTAADAAKDPPALAPAEPTTPEET